MISVKINSQPAQLEAGTTLAQLAEQQSLPQQGVAVAINNAMVPRTEWPSRTLAQGDDIVILKAFCGG